MKKKQKIYLVVSCIVLILSGILLLIVIDPAFLHPEEFESKESEGENIKSQINALKNTVYLEKDFLTATADNLDFSEMIHYDGSVGKIVDEEKQITTHPPHVVEQTFFIKNRYNDTNDGKTRDLYISLQNPQKGHNREQGLHDNLETETLRVYINHPFMGEFNFYCPDCSEPSEPYENMWINDRWCYNGNMYHIPHLFGPDDEIRFEIKYRLDKAVSGTFQDGQTYSCRYWIIDINYDEIQEVLFEVKT